ncbi:MAG: DNA polymerase III subunit beta [Ignavibacterium sp.]
MEFTIKKSDLLDALQVTRVVGQSFLPVTEGVLLKTNDSLLKTTCTNLETVYNRSVTISSMSFASEESLVLPAKKLLEIVRQMPDVLLTFTTSNDSAIIKYDQNIINLKGYDANDYPELPKTKTVSQFKVSSRNLQKGINSVSPAISNDGTRPIFTGISFEIDKDRKIITLCATDGYRLHTDIVDIEETEDSSTNQIHQILVPGKNIKEIQDLKSDDINIRICDGYVVFSDEKAIVTIRLISGIYPEYKRLIPSEFTTKIKVNSQEIISALNRAKIVAEDPNVIAIVNISISSDSVQVIAKSESGELKESLKSVQVSGEPLNINFNVQYLLTALKVTSLEETEVLLNFNNANSACIVTPVTGTNLCLVLPTRMKE